MPGSLRGGSADLVGRQAALGWVLQQGIKEGAGWWGRVRHQLLQGHWHHWLE